MASNLFSLFMGFTFTAIVVLLTWVGDPSQIRIQTVLFFLVLLFHVLGFLLFVEEALLAYCVRTAPQLPKNYRGT
jgi:amino acid permease